MFKRRCICFEEDNVQISAVIVHPDKHVLSAFPERQLHRVLVSNIHRNSTIDVMKEQFTKLNGLQNLLEELQIRYSIDE